MIGSRLIMMCRNADYEITVLSRSPDRAVTKFGGRIKAMRSLEEWAPDMVFDAVINLAGAPIATRWTDNRKKVIWDSRVTLTEKLVRQISLVRKKPEVLISGSAVGYYGDTGSVTVDENTVMFRLGIDSQAGRRFGCPSLYSEDGSCIER